MYEGRRAKYCAEEVNICQGSRYKKDIRKYSPTVEPVETIRFVKILLPIVRDVLGFLSCEMTI